MLPCRLTLAGEFLAEYGGIAGVGEAGFEIDDAIADELGDFAIEVLHAFGGAGFHSVEQGLAFVFAFFDALAGASIGFENFSDRDASGAIDFWQQPLTDDVAERFGEALAHVLLFCGGE
jgi:hypothetical protein